VSVTALQVISAYSAIANGGLLMEPKFVKAIVDDSDESKWQFTPASVRRVISAETTRRLTEILSKVVEQGTGQFAQVQWRKDLKVAGKTGTAQKFDNLRKKYHEDQTLVSFCGFFPADAPKYTMIVIFDEPEGKRWGGSDAAPVFRRIAEQMIPLPTS
jgi:cell division protein FtsI (penicillin-binding protein 3)